MRDSYGDLASVFRSASEDLNRGELQNAWTGFELALSMWLRSRFVDATGRVNSTIYDSRTLLSKLRSATVIDRWLFDVLSASMQRPRELTWAHLDAMRAIVEAVCFGAGCSASRTLQGGRQ